MLLKEIELFPLKESIKDLDRLYAHTKSLDTPKETLEEHLACSIKYFDMINKKKELNKVWPRIYECLKIQSQEEIKFFNELFINAIYIHDIGKININYQFQKMGNNNF